VQDRGRLGVLLVAPALAAVLVLFVYPLGYSLVTAFQAKGGGFTLGNFAKAFEFYSVDIGFTLVMSWVLSRNESRTFALDFRIRHVY